ncbi:hypothetical protein [Streptomyces sp. NBC_00724]|uniref:hypothetical protein n=1 Tax=Streptomyces sp. NBC_00724 TaxID=2975812 RepID=UPI002ED28B3B|nr:hypothetical protein OHB17_42355 [Streptomyces sp. NBC_00724]
MTEETFFGHGWQPLTLTVLQAIWFLPASAEFNVGQLVNWFDALGWKSANGKPLGEDAVRRELKLIREAGYVRAYRVKGENGRMAGMRYEISKRQMPPQEQIGVVTEFEVKPQVGPHASNERTWMLPGTDKAEIRRSVHVPPMTAHGDPPNMVDQAKPQATPCASNHGAPPTPPYREEEDSSSLKSSSITPGASATAVAAAAEFLAELPGRWACGRKSAAELAPLLAEAVQEQDWKLSGDLVQQLTRRSQARRGALSVLRERIEDLPRYRAARVAAGRVPGQQLALEDSEQGRSRAVPLPEGVSTERVDQARAFLLTLTGPWALGPESAVRLAPLLAAKSQERGWEFDNRLLSQLMSNPAGVLNYELVLEKHRITSLPFRRSTASGQPRDTQDTRQKAIDACGTCDAYGQFERDGAAVLCKHDEPSATSAPKGAGPRASSSASPAAADGAALPEAANRSLARLLTSMRQPAI